MSSCKKFNAHQHFYFSKSNCHINNSHQRIQKIQLNQQRRLTCQSKSDIQERFRSCIHSQARKGEIIRRPLRMSEKQAYQDFTTNPVDQSHCTTIFRVRPNQRVNYHMTCQIYIPDIPIPSLLRLTKDFLSTLQHTYASPKPHSFFQLPYQLSSVFDQFLIHGIQ